MDYKILRRKDDKTVFGRIHYNGKLTMILDFPIPDLFNNNKTINDIKESLNGINESDLNDYELIPVQLLTILP